MPRPVTPEIAADIIIELLDDPGKIVLIERKYEPLGKAIPGGFVDVGERIEAAARREAKEEVCLEVELVTLLGLYSDPARDARGHTVTAVYVARAHGRPQAADDAREVVVVDANDDSLSMAFDHEQVLRDYRRWRDSGEVTPLC